MKKHLLFIILGFCFFYSCSTPASNNLIDYQDLKKIDTELLIEIGESESFLPGRLNELIVTSDGSILVSDWASITIEQFDSTGKHIATIAKEGGGPGELSSYFDMRDMGNGTVLVSHRGGQRDFFAAGANGVFELVQSSVPAEKSKRSITVIYARSDSTFFATTGRMIKDIQQLFKNADAYYKTPLVTVNSSFEILADSLHMLKSSAGHITRFGNNGIRIDQVPYRYEDRFLPMSNGNYMIARPDSSALLIYNSSHKLHRRIPLKVKPRPVTESDLEYALKDIDEPIHSEIASRVHEIKPPYLNIWASEHYIWLYTDTGEKGKQIVVIDYDGNPLGKFLLPNVDDIHHIESEKIYTIHRDPEVGNTIRIYEIEI